MVGRWLLYPEDGWEGAGGSGGQRDAMQPVSIPEHIEDCCLRGRWVKQGLGGGGSFVLLAKGWARHHCQTLTSPHASHAVPAALQGQRGGAGRPANVPGGGEAGEAGQRWAAPNNAVLTPPCFGSYGFT